MCLRALRNESTIHGSTRLCAKVVAYTLLYVEDSANFYHPSSSPLPRIDVSSSPYVDSFPTTTPHARQNPRQRIIIHQVPFLLPSSCFTHCLYILFLILRQYQLSSPSTSTSTTSNSSLATARPADRLRYAVSIPTRIPLHVLLEMQRRLSSRSVGATRHPCQRRFTAARTELTRHFLGGLEAGVTA